MVKPTQPKGIKPKADMQDAPEGGKAGAKLGIGGGMQPIIVNAVISVLICSAFVTSNYFITKITLDSAVKQMGAGGSTEEDPGAGADSEVEQPGIILDLGEFILNLSDPKAKRYLKINVAIELTRLETDPVIGGAKTVAGKVVYSPVTLVSGGEGEGAKDGMALIQEEMNQYKPAIRDAIISTLSSKTAEELSSVAGKELAKEQIKEAVNAIFGGVREVKRVSFGNFIIQ